MPQEMKHWLATLDTSFKGLQPLLSFLGMCLSMLASMQCAAPIAQWDKSQPPMIPRGNEEAGNIIGQTKWKAHKK